MRGRCPAGFVELIGKPDAGYACNKDVEVMRVLISVCHHDCVGNTETLGWGSLAGGVALVC